MDNKNKKLKIILSIIIVMTVIASLLLIIYYIINKKANTYPENYTYGNTQENQTNNGILVTDDNYIFYCVKDYRDKNYIFRRTKTTGEVLELTTSNAKFLNIYNDYLYYINEENSIFRIKKDGSDRQRVVEEATNMCIENNYLYYINDNMFEGLFKLDLETNKNKEITNIKIKEFTIYKEYIYYINEEDNQLYRIDINGNNNQNISTDNLSNICVVNNKIYALNSTDGNSIYEFSLDGVENRKILSMDKALKNNGYIIVNNMIGILQEFATQKYIYFYDFNSQEIGKLLVQDLYKNLGIYLPNNTKFAVYDNIIFVDSNYGRYDFFDINNIEK